MPLKISTYDSASAFRGYENPLLFLRRRPELFVFGAAGDNDPLFTNIQ